MWTSNVVFLKQGCGGKCSLSPWTWCLAVWGGPRMPSFKPGLHKFVCWGPACPIFSGAPWRPPLHLLVLFILGVFFEGLVWCNFCTSSNFRSHKKSHQSKLRSLSTQWKGKKINEISSDIATKHPYSSGTFPSGLPWIAPACFLWMDSQGWQLMFASTGDAYQSLSMVWSREPFVLLTDIGTFSEHKALCSVPVKCRGDVLQKRKDYTQTDKAEIFTIWWW